jgi:uncharacterized protein YdhG (YjbR/CyaY superfamily)
MAGKQATPADAAAAKTWIDAYLAALPDDQHAALQSLRETVAATAPEAVEAISYGIPAFRYRGEAIVWYHATKRHCSFFPTGEPIDAHREALAEFEVSKGTIRFTPDHPLPKDLVAEMVRYRVGQVDAKAAGRAARKA